MVATAIAPWMKSYLLKRGSTEEATHLLMSGGQLLVHPSARDQFHAELAASISAGDVNYLCEKRSNERLKLCVDLDAYTQEAQTLADVTPIVKVAAGVARELFGDAAPPNALNLLLCSAESKTTQKQGLRCVKNGFHLIWEHLVVDVRSAGVFRDALVQRLELSRGIKPPINGWSTGIDSAVAKNGILRMLWAHKCQDCPVCKNKRAAREGCENCLTTGRVDEGRPYRLTASYALGDDALELIPPAEDAATIAMHLSRASIRAEDAPVPMNACKPAWFEDPILPFIGANNRAAARVTKRSRKQMAAQLTEGHDSVDGIMDRELIHARPVLDIIQRFIQGAARRGLLNGAYVDAEVTQAFHAHERSSVYVKLDSCFCMNIMAEHKSNTVFCVIKRAGELRFACFCRCDTTEGRRKGLCSAYRSHPIVVSDKVLDALFPPGSATGSSEHENEGGVRTSMPSTMRNAGRSVLEAAMERAKLKKQKSADQ